MNEIRLIDANALKEKGIKWFIDERYYHPLDKPENMSESIFSSLIDNAPTVDKGYDFGYADGHGEGYELGKNSRSQGEWKIIEHETLYLMGIYQCNLCSYKYICPDEFARNYCPNCGAEMWKGGAE